jgi:hypothetical protein
MGGWYWIDLAQDRDMWLNLVNAVKKTLGIYDMRGFLD